MLRSIHTERKWKFLPIFIRCEWEHFLRCLKFSLISCAFQNFFFAFASVFAFVLCEQALRRAWIGPRWRKSVRLFYLDDMTRSHSLFKVMMMMIRCFWMSYSIVYPFMTRMELHEPFPLNEMDPRAGYLNDDSMSALFTRNVFSTVFLAVLKWVEWMPLLLFTHDAKIRQKSQKCRWQKWA